MGLSFCSFSHFADGAMDMAGEAMVQARALHQFMKDMYLVMI